MNNPDKPSYSLEQKLKYLKKANKFLKCKNSKKASIIIEEVFGGYRKMSKDLAFAIFIDGKG